MISFASKEDVPALMKLWKEAFSEEAFARMFYDMIFNSGMCEEVKIIVDRQENNGKESEPEIISMLHYIPCSYENGAVKCNGAYLYALATDKRYRCRGIMGEMIEYAKKLAVRQKAVFLYLLPAEDRLYGYYERFGFDVVRNKKLPSGLFSETLQSGNIRLQKLSVERFMELALKKWEVSDITLMFHEKIVEYTVQELFSEEDFEGYEMVKNGQPAGYYGIYGGKIIACGMIRNTVLWEEQKNDAGYEKSGSVFWIGTKQDIAEVRGYIPY